MDENLNHDDIKLKVLLNKFFKIGAIVIMLIGLNIWCKYDIFMIFVGSNYSLQIYSNITGLLYKISFILVPIFSLILFKIMCDVIYFVSCNKKV